VTKREYEVMAAYVRRFRRSPTADPRAAKLRERIAGEIIEAFCSVARDCYSGNRGGFDRDRFVAACDITPERTQKELI
jgi:hypothetical protein